jgi:hypothetical protein
MSVDRSNRDRAADAIAAYLRGEIDNFSLSDQTLDLDSADASLRKTVNWVWGCYDDLIRHRVHATREGWDFLVRCLVFLRTALELPKGAKHRPRDAIPFGSVDEWSEYKHLIERERLPAFDPNVQQRSPWGPILGARITLRWFLAGVASLSFLVYLICRCR